MGSRITNRKVESLPSVSKTPEAREKAKPKAKESIMRVEIPKPKGLITEQDRIRMDVRPLTKLQRQGLVQATSSLRESGACLQNGAKVTRQSHAIKWILERFGEFAEK